MFCFVRKFVICCLAGFTSPVLASGKTVIIEADSWCPYNCAQTSREPGFMVDVAREILGSTGYKVIYRNQPWTIAVGNVAAGRADAIIGASASEAKEFVLAGEPLGQNTTCLYTRVDDPFVYKAGTPLVGRRIGGASGYLYGDMIDKYIAENRSKYDLVQIVTGDKPLLQNIRKLKDLRIDTLIENQLVMEFSTKKYRLDGVRLAGCDEPSSLHIAFSPKREDAGRLADIMNQGIRDLRRNGRMAAILAKYGVKDWK